MANETLINAKRVKNDEFYTQYGDIQKEVEAYLEYNPDVFRNKIVYCNCDDPYESNFFKYFALNFNRLGLKKIITTCYVSSPIAGEQLPLKQIEGLKPENRKPFKLKISEVKDVNKDGAVNLVDVGWLLKNDANTSELLKGDGDFRSNECIELLEQSDVIVTNPPFSLFSEYIKQLVEHGKKFLIIGNMNAITYKEVFPLIKENKMWLGTDSGQKIYQVPDSYEQENVFVGEDGKRYTKMGNTGWFTNLDHGRRHQPLPLMTEADVIKFATQKPFIEYDNYNAIEVCPVKNIPSDYKGVMGVPVSFLDKYNPEQFEILGTSDNGLVDDKFKRTPGLTKRFVNDYYKSGGTGSYKEGNPTAGYYEDGIAKMAYKRIFIRHKKK
ncbi:MAG: DNA methyltransferase [Candidatus Kaiserbacteria bacterium]|nr:DNA methyltransferase [Candidatus Kaiserbacteria bacterium]